MKHFGVIFILLGAAWGQTTLTLSSGETVEANCTREITFGHTTKRVRVLFPEECPPITYSWTPATLYGDGKREPPTDMDSKILQESKPDPVDIPAIRVKVDSWQCFVQDSPGCTITDKDGVPVAAGVWWSAANPKDYTLWRESCDDKTRILQHDEQDTPKYWCHKVQP